jgi:4a-hydroxytetrahydrobiopterin dehydratase
MELKNKKCQPCEGGISKLNTEEIQDHLKLISEKWVINGDGHLFRKFNFVNFRHTMDFVNNVALLAEEEGHHPDFFISYGNCNIELWTHTINGLSENDFILAVKIDDLP